MLTPRVRSRPGPRSKSQQPDWAAEAPDEPMLSAATGESDHMFQEPAGTSSSSSRHSGFGRLDQPGDSLKTGDARNRSHAAHALCAAWHWLAARVAPPLGVTSHASHHMAARNGALMSQGLLARADRRAISKLPGGGRVISGADWGPPCSCRGLVSRIRGRAALALVEKRRHDVDKELMTDRMTIVEAVEDETIAK